MISAYKRRISLFFLEVEILWMFLRWIFDRYSTSVERNTQNWMIIWCKWKGRIWSSHPCQQTELKLRVRNKNVPNATVFEAMICNWKNVVFLSLFLLRFLGDATESLLDGTFHTLFYQQLTIVHVVILVNQRVNRKFIWFVFIKTNSSTFARPIHLHSR